MPNRKFKLEELNSREYLLWELEHEVEKPKHRQNNGKKGGATDNNSLFRSMAKCQRQLIRDNEKIIELLREIKETKK